MQWHVNDILCRYPFHFQVEWRSYLVAPVTVYFLPASAHPVNAVHVERGHRPQTEPQLVLLSRQPSKKLDGIEETEE